MPVPPEDPAGGVLSFGCSETVVSQRQAGLVTVCRVFVKHALGDGTVNGRHGGLKKVACCSGIARGDCSAQTPHQRADPSAVRAVHFSALTSLRRPLQNRLFLLLNFGSLSLGHLLLLLGVAQTSNVKRGRNLCQTSRRFKILRRRSSRRRPERRARPRGAEIQAPRRPGDHRLWTTSTMSCACW